MFHERELLFRGTFDDSPALKPDDEWFISSFAMDLIG